MIVTTRKLSYISDIAIDDVRLYNCSGNIYFSEKLTFDKRPFYILKFKRDKENYERECFVVLTDYIYVSFDNTVKLQ